MSTLPNAPPLPTFLKLLAHEVRWHLLTALVVSDHRVQELVNQLQRPQNLISYHLRLLKNEQIVRERRSSADGRDVYYSLDVEHLHTLYLDSGQTLHPALALTPPVIKPGDVPPGLNEQPFRVLFLCTHNSARSQLAEGILRTSGGALVAAFSAGSQPGSIHPLAIRAAQTFNIDLSGQRPKHMDEFTGQTFDYVITVCDQVREICPVFPHEPQQIHWSFPDPVALNGPEAEQIQAFLQTARELTVRIRYLRLMMERRRQENKVSS